MPLSNLRPILKKTVADRVALAYQPLDLPNKMMTPADEFVTANETGSVQNGFKLNPLIAKRTGIYEHEQNLALEAIERGALEKLKDIEERAYQEAYNLGLEEGKKEAFANQRQEFKERLESFSLLLSAMENLKQDMVRFNETHIVNLAFYLAGKVVLQEVESKPELLLPVLKSVLESSMNEEHVTIRVSQRDKEFLETIQKDLGKDLDFLKRTKIETDTSVQDGGCIIETNYGVVDATLSERLSKLWTTLNGVAPRVKDEIS